MSTETPAIEINQLVRKYGKTDAVNGLSLSVRPGRCYGFFGRNGAGKTTTIRCLLNLLRPTSGLDPIVRREFIQTIIGAYQESGPTRRTVFVSTHLISEFEGLIDEFTIIEDGRAALTLDADAAREKYKKIRARFGGAPPLIEIPGILSSRQMGRDLEIVANGATDQIVEKIRSYRPESVSTEALALEEIFMVSLK